MNRNAFNTKANIRRTVPVCSLVWALCLGVLPAVAQQQQDNLPGYPAGNGQQPSSAPGPADHSTAQSTQPQANPNPNDQPPMPQGTVAQNEAPSTQTVPSTLTVPPGTVIQVRTNEWLSTDRNLPGDGFNATLAQPIIVDGWVVARRGQAVLGRVTVVEKAKSSNHNTSQLGVQLSELTFVDGQLLPIQTQLAQSATTADRGQQLGTVGATTGTGAVIGAIAGGGTGAAIGAGVGAIAGLGIVTTHGRPTVIPPETLLTFRLEAPASVSTVKSHFAFQPVTPADYNGTLASNGPRRMMGGDAYPPPPYWGYPYAYDPYFYPGWGFYPGPVLGFGFGPRYYGRFYGGYGRFR
jgi:hypothetical protein